jgi:Flp pilus assembly protein TadD
MYRAALRLQPDLAGAHLGLAGLAQNYPEAEYHFKAAIYYRPTDARAHYDYGLGLATAERFREDAAEFETAVRLEPAFAEAHASLGDMLAIQNKPSQANKRALSLQPNLESAHTGLEMATRQKR